MTGFEIAGIALGIFPVLYETGKDIRERYKHLKEWWKFESAFTSFLQAIETEHIAFSQNLELLLAPLDISLEEKRVLEEDCKSPFWHDPSIQVKLRERIQNRYYSWYMVQLKDINDALQELRSFLPVEKASIKFSWRPCYGVVFVTC